MKRTLKVLLVNTLGVLVSFAMAQEFVCFDRQSEQAHLQFVGAEEAYTHDDAPWMVNLSFGGQPFCGGALVNRSTVLTAAHCVTSGIVVRLAANDGSPNGDALRVTAYAVHPDYTTSTRVSANDVAVLKLAGEFDVSLSSLPYLLDRSRSQTWGQPGDCAWAMGWGLTEEQGDRSPVLVGGYVPLWADATCRRSYGDQLFSGTVCAGYEEGMRGTCQGDSGGPLLVRGGPTGVIQVGVVSYGIGCARQNFPTVFVRVSEYYDWIFQAAEELAGR